MLIATCKICKKSFMFDVIELEMENFYCAPCAEQTFGKAYLENAQNNAEEMDSEDLQ